MIATSSKVSNWLKRALGKATERPRVTLKNLEKSTILLLLENTISTAKHGGGSVVLSECVSSPGTGTVIRAEGIMDAPKYRVILEERWCTRDWNRFSPFNSTMTRSYSGVIKNQEPVKDVTTTQQRLILENW